MCPGHPDSGAIECIVLALLIAYLATDIHHDEHTAAVWSHTRWRPGHPFGEIAVYLPVIVGSASGLRKSITTAMLAAHKPQQAGFKSEQF